MCQKMSSEYAAKSSLAEDELESLLAAARASSERRADSRNAFFTTVTLRRRPRNKSSLHSRARYHAVVSDCCTPLRYLRTKTMRSIFESKRSECAESRAPYGVDQSATVGS
jgi:hypothetical protein